MDFDKRLRDTGADRCDHLAPQGRLDVDMDVGGERAGGEQVLNACFERPSTMFLCRPRPYRADPSAGVV